MFPGKLRLPQPSHCFRHTPPVLAEPIPLLLHEHMASKPPIVWPPDRGFRPGVAPAGQAAADNASAFERLVRYAEKDDLLLYLTALFGIFMPAVMYFVYKTIHAKYQAYAKVSVLFLGLSDFRLALLLSASSIP